MFKSALIILFSIVLTFSAFASTPTGKISSITFIGKEPSELIMVVVEPKASDCPYPGNFIMNTKDRPGMVSGLLAAFQAQNTVTIHGTGSCHATWSNHEVINYAVFKK